MQLSKELDRNIEISCEICAKKLDYSQKILTCCLCNCKVHPKCNKKKIDNVNKIDNRYECAFCFNCKENILPFQKDFITQPNAIPAANENINFFS